MSLSVRLLPVVLGALAALGQAPFDLPLVMIAAMAFAISVSVDAKTPWRAAVFGWSFGVGYFAVSLHWIVSPFLVDVARHGWMAPFAVILLAAGMALFWGAAFWGARKLSPRPWALILCWPLAELARAYIFTGFPWASPAQALVDSFAGQALAWIGPHGLNTAVVAAAVGISARQWWLRWGLVVPLVAVVLVAPMAPPAPLTGTVLRLIQPNAPQHQKWDPMMIPVFYARQLDFTAAPAQGRKAPDAIVWPETAIPWSLDRAAPVLEEISAAAQGKPVIMGVQRSEDMRYYNALVVLGPDGDVTQTYDKHHLVPFGEYIPFGDLAARFGITSFAQSLGNGFASGPGARLLDLGPLGRALPLICYEAVFAHDLNAAPARAGFIIHATNDAWFGTYAGPQQHLAQARMRAIEQGLPVARAANTGISAMIDPWGRITDRLGLGQAGFFDAELPQPRGATLYSFTGDLPLGLILLAAVAWAALSRRTRARK